MQEFTQPSVWGWKKTKFHKPDLRKNLDPSVSTYKESNLKEELDVY